MCCGIHLHMLAMDGEGNPGTNVADGGMRAWQENILLCNKPARGQKLQVKLADFGIATIVGSDAAQGAMTYCGTPHYFAPEVHRRQPEPVHQRAHARLVDPERDEATRAE